MQKIKISQITRKLFINLVALPGVISVFLLLISSIYIVHRNDNLAETEYLESSKSLFVQLILSGDSSNLNRQISSMSKILNFSHASVWSATGEAIVSTGNTFEKCNNSFKLDTANIHSGTICFERKFGARFIWSLIAISIFSICALAMLAVAYVKSRNLLTILSNRIETISDSIKEKDYVAISKNEPIFYEEENLRDSFLEFISKENSFQKERLIHQQTLTISQVASQTAHDIRSPLSALNIIGTNLEDMTSDKIKLFQSAVHRIREISDDLMAKSKRLNAEYRKNNIPQTLTFSESTRPNQFREIELSALIDTQVSEKKYILENKGIEILFNQVEILFYSMADETHLSRVISNLINNAIESYRGDNLKIEINISKFGTYENLIEVRDNGRGIAAENVERLGKEVISFGKEGFADSGSGLGLSHAFSYVSSINGRLDIQSVLGSGTTVKIFLPASR